MFRVYAIRVSLLLLNCIICCSCIRVATPEERLIQARVEYLYDLKSLIGEKIWPGVDDPKFDVPLLYYSDSVCYAVNPGKKFLQQHDSQLLSGKRGINIYKTTLPDSIPFHMSVSFSFGDDSESYDYRTPYLKCSSFEITGGYVPDVPSVEMWATMVIHEYFHGYQFSHPLFLEYYERILGTTQGMLKKLYDENTGYKEMVDSENAILLAALAMDNGKEILNKLSTFRDRRNGRRLLMEGKTDFPIADVEKGYETIEGTARYVEYGLYKEFSYKKPDSKLVKADASYDSYSCFRDFDMNKEKWLYATEYTPHYFYATGFNIARILDKLGVDYKSRLFNEEHLTLEDILTGCLDDNIKTYTQ